MTFVEDLLSFKVATIPAAWEFLWVVEEEPCWCSCDPLHVNKPLSYGSFLFKLHIISKL